MEVLKHLRVTKETQDEFFRIQRELALTENRRVTQEEVQRILITNYRNTHTESKKNMKRGYKQ